METPVEIFRNNTWQPLEGALAKRGNPPVKLSLAKYTRDFLTSTPKGARCARIQEHHEALHEIAKDSSNKSCVQAIQLLWNRAYGDVPKELSIKASAADLIGNLREEAQQHILALLTGDKDSFFVASESNTEASDVQPDDTIQDAEIVE